MKTRNVAIVGGTHGNELTGVYLLRRWATYPDAISRPSFKTNLFLANPKAVQQNRRFIDKEQPYLNSICPCSLAMEIGPIAQGLLRSDIIALTDEVVKHGLDYLQSINEGKPPAVSDSIEVFEFKESVPFPQTDGTIIGTIHSLIWMQRDRQPLTRTVG
jgi:succinylglutamate desuccinylase